MSGSSRAQSKSETVGAVLLLTCGVILFAVMDGISKLMSTESSVVQLVWARYMFAVPVVLAVTAPSAWLRLLQSEQPGLQVGRSLLPVLANTTAVMALGLMPLADATAITFVYPLLVVALSVPLLGERVSARSWLGVAAGFAGILVMVRPGAGTVAWTGLFPLATAFFFGLYQVLTRLVSREDRPVVTLAWTIAAGLAVTTALLPFRWNHVDGSDWLLLILSGILFGLGQLLLIRAFAMAPAAVLAPFSYVQIIAAVVFGAVVFGQLPDTWTLAGITLVVLAGVYVLRRQTG